MSTPDPRREEMRAVIAAAGGTGTGAGWSALWQKQLTIWDLQKQTPVFVDELATALASGRVKREGAVLVPGCGSAYDVAALVQAGMQRVVAIDIAPEAVERATQLLVGAPGVELVCGDFFSSDALSPASFSFVFDYT